MGRARRPSFLMLPSSLVATRTDAGGNGTVSTVGRRRFAVRSRSRRRRFIRKARMARVLLVGGVTFAKIRIRFFLTVDSLFSDGSRFGEN